MSIEKTVNSGIYCFPTLFSDVANSSNMPAPIHKKIFVSIPKDSIYY